MPVLPLVTPALRLTKSFSSARRNALAFSAMLSPKATSRMDMEAIRADRQLDSVQAIRMADRVGIEFHRDVRLSSHQRPW